MKDFVRLGDKQKINVVRAEVDPDSRNGWIQLADEANLLLAIGKCENLGDWPVPEKVLKEPDFFRRRRDWKGYRMRIFEKQSVGPNDGVSSITRFSPPQATLQSADFIYGPYIGQPRSHLAAAQHLQGRFVNQTNPSSPAIGHASPPLNYRFSAIVPHNPPGYSSSALPRSYPYVASPSEYGSSGSASNFDSASIASSTTSDPTPPTHVYLTEPRGVHIGNVPFETSESEIRRFVARRLRIQDDEILDVALPTNALGKQKGYALISFETRAMAESAKDALDGITFRKNRLKVKTDQDRQTLYPSNLSTASHSVTYSNYRHQSQRMETAPPQYWQRPSSYPLTSATHEDEDPGEYAEQPSSANPEPDTTIPAVVDGSKHRHARNSRIQGEEQSTAAQSSNGAVIGSSVDWERSSKEQGDSKSKKGGGDDSKGKQKHKRR